MKKKKMHGGPHMDKMMGGGKYKMGHGGMYGKKKMPHGGKHDMDMEMYGGGMMTDARNRSQMMQVGGKTLKEVDAMQNPGLAKLPTKVRNKMGYKQEGGKLKKVAEVLTPVPRKESGKFDDPFMKGSKKKSGEEKGAMAGFALGTLAGGPLGALAGMLAGKYAGRAKEMNSIVKAAEKRAGKKLSPTRKKFIKAFTLAERKGMDKFTFDGKEYSTKRKQMGGGMYSKKKMGHGGIMHGKKKAKK